MPITLTVSQTLSNGTRLLATGKRWNEDKQVISYEVSLRTPTNGTPPDAVIAVLAGEIRAPSSDYPAGKATVIARNTVPVAGAPLSALLMYLDPIAVSAQQYADALAALKGTAKNFEDHLLTRYLHGSLAGT